MSRFRLPAPLRPLADGAEEIAVGGNTLATALHELVERHPHLRRHLFDDSGALRGYVNLYIGDDDVRYLDGLDTRVGDDVVITIVPSVAGGATIGAVWGMPVESGSMGQRAKGSKGG
jgi:molybdopterin converting factor small subunit